MYDINRKPAFAAGGRAVSPHLTTVILTNNKSQS
jgi:hypothetical protein